MQYTEIFNNEMKKICSINVWSSISNSYVKLHKSALQTSTVDPKFNTIHWANDVALVCEEIKYSMAWMRAHAIIYKDANPPGSNPTDVSTHVSYYADNAITRIQSCRDKIALMVWAHFCPFNPEEFKEIIDLDYNKILKRFKTPTKYGISSNQYEQFLSHLNTLNNGEFKWITDYRHMKIHRREPRIEIYGVKPHHDWPYNLAIIDEKEIRRWEESIIDDPLEEHMPGELRIQSTYDGILYESKKLPTRLWDYEDVNNIIDSSSLNLVSAAVGCFQIIRRRSPFRKRR